MSACELSPQEWERYARQIGPGVLSREEQKRLKNSAALVTRVGGMGGPASLCLTMAGVGRVIIAHGGTLISPDLNRQVLGCEAAHRRPQGPALWRVPAFHESFRADPKRSITSPTAEEATELAQRVDVILSCPPGFEERMRLNRIAIETGTPLIDAAQWGMSGTLIVRRPRSHRLPRMPLSGTAAVRGVVPRGRRDFFGDRSPGCLGSNQDPLRLRPAHVRQDVDD